MALLGWLDPPGHHQDKSSAVVLAQNISGRFESRWSRVVVETSKSVLLKGMEGAKLGVWVAHGEGRFIYCTQQVLPELESDGCTLSRYTTTRPTHSQNPFKPKGTHKDWSYEDYRRQQNFLNQAGRQVAVRQAGRQVTVRQQIKEKAYGQKGKGKDSKGFVKNQKKEKVEESAMAAAAATGITDDHKQHKTDEKCSPLSHLKNSFKDFQEGTDSSEDIGSCEESEGEADSADNADQTQQKNKIHKKINKENQLEEILSVRMML
nr:uncharacterized protein LOC128701188 [Cherax quadricarinatus]